MYDLPWPEIGILHFFKYTWRNISKPTIERKQCCIMFHNFIFVPWLSKHIKLLPLKHHINALAETCCAGGVNWWLVGKVRVELGNIIFACKCRLEWWFKFTIDNISPIDVLKIFVSMINNQLDITFKCTLTSKMICLKIMVP